MVANKTFEIMEGLDELAGEHLSSIEKSDLSIDLKLFSSKLILRINRLMSLIIIHADEIGSIVARKEIELCLDTLRQLNDWIGIESE